MSHLVGDYTGGGTNFPFLPQPSHDEWCGVIDYDEEGKDGYQGIILKPMVGYAIFWKTSTPKAQDIRASTMPPYR
ncbi:hypothetical protein F4825DRAFT_423549 [Nemania diffusa]|nr:hypothetical protein F4825DRAFT_423549 [Nemania diffusa]